MNFEIAETKKTSGLHKATYFEESVEGHVKQKHKDLFSKYT